MLNCGKAPPLIIWLHNRCAVHKNRPAPAALAQCLLFEPSCLLPCRATILLFPSCRGMVGPDEQLWLDDYPYAQDGMDLWNALLDYFSAYLKLYYSSDGEVAYDPELQAWWQEVKVSRADQALEEGGGGYFWC
jgi:hypothetical protein